MDDHAAKPPGGGDRDDLIIVALLLALHRKVDRIINTLQDVQDDVTQETSVEASVLTLLQGLADQVKNLQPNQAAIDALHAQLTQNIANLQAAVTANTPADTGGNPTP